MVYNWQNNIMKKLLALVAFVFSISLYSNAQSGSNSCRIEGGGYIQADYYEDGRLVISNQSESKTTSVRVTVTCTVTYWVSETYYDYDPYGNRIEKERPVKKTKHVTIFSGTLYDFEPYSSTEIPNSRNSVSIKAQKDFAERSSVKETRYDYNVTVGNPICK